MARILLLVLMGLSVLGCGSRPHEDRRASRRMAKPQPVAAQVATPQAQASAMVKSENLPKVTFVPFAYESAVLVEDASQFSRFAMEYFSGRNLAEFKQGTAILKDATDFLDGLKSPSGDWAWRHGVEYITSGIVHEYSYKADSRNLNMAVDFTLNVLSANDLSQVYTNRQKVSRSFRVGANTSDYTAQNRAMLEELLGRFERDLKKLKSAKPPVQEVAKTAEVSKSASVWGEISAPTMEAREIKTAEEQNPIKESEFKVVRLPEITETEVLDSVHTAKAEPNSRIEELRNRLREFSTKPQVTRLPEIRDSAQVAAPPVAVVRTAPETKKAEVSLSNLVAEGLLDLRMDEFVLAHPLVMDPQKRYEKFFYLPKTSATQEETLRSFDMASKSNLTIEVFSTISEYAVRKFLIDYFEGLPANPTGRIPEAYERTQMGKYQLGFMIGKRAFIVTSPRESREKVLTASGNFYVRNGGHDLNQILSGKVAPKPESTIQIVKDPAPAKVQVPVNIAPAKVAEVVKVSPKVVEAPVIKAQPKVETPAKVAVSQTVQKEPETKKMVEEVSPSSVIAAHIKSENLLQALEYEEVTPPRSTLAKTQNFSFGQENPAQEKVTTGVVSEAERIASLLEDIRLPATVRPAAPRPLVESRPAQIQEVVEVDVVIPAQTNVAVAKTVETPVAPTQAKGKEEALKHTSRKGLIEDFYAEMEKIEAELEQVRSRRTGLMTIASHPGHVSLWELFFQGIMLLGLGVMVFAFVRERKLR